MNHSEIKFKLYEYLDGELSRAEALYITQHLELCPECKLETQGWEVNRKLLLMGSRFQVPAGFSEGVMKKVVTVSESIPKKKPFHIWDYLNLPRWEIAAASAGFLVIASYFTIDHYLRKVSDSQDLYASAYSEVSSEGLEVTLYE